MRIVFMGTPDFAIPSLKILLDHQYDIASVVTAPDKPAGRGLQLLESPVKRFALQHKLPVLTPEKLKDPPFVDHLKSLRPDLFVVVAFRILPPEVLRIPTCGAFNLHASLLPKYRGAAPINWAIINGEAETGVTTFFLEEKVDTGNIILQTRVPISPDETAGELHDKLTNVGADAVLKTVKLIETGRVVPISQDNSLATPAPKIFTEHCRIDWNKGAQAVHNFIRGLSPRPAAYTYHGETFLKIYRSRLSGLINRKPGEILKVDRQLIVGTGNKSIELLEIQQEGKKKLSAEEFLRGYRLQPGEQFS